MPYSHKAYLIRRLSESSEKAGKAAEAALKLGHGRVGLIVAALERAVDRSEDKILKHIDVFRVNDLRLDLDALKLTGAEDDGLDRTAAGRELESRGLQLLLHLQEVLLHLLRLLHHVKLVAAGITAAESAFCHSIFLQKIVFI